MPQEGILAKIDRFPQGPGVYILRDAKGRVIYVGKAVNLRSRVRQYFTKGSDTRILAGFIPGRTADAECIVTANEAEALILENNLIKKHRPPLNIRLKDDKTYGALKVTLSEEWPRVLPVRRFKDDGSRYFGPFSSAGALRQLLRVIQQVFTLRNCSNGFFQGRTRPCMEHEIGRCSGPCVGRISRERYLEDVREVLLLLKGRSRELLEALEAKMTAAAGEHRYELAARYRDQIAAVQKVFQAQQAQEFRIRDLDAFGAFRQGDVTAVQEVLVRDGKVVHSRCHPFRSPLSTEEILGSFLAQYYLSERPIPPEVLCDRDFPDREILQASLAGRRGGAVSIAVPRRGEKLRLVEMARANAQNGFEIERTRGERTGILLASLRERLGLARTPRAIECFDISCFQGALAVGAMVRFEDGEPVKARYRKFRIRTVPGADDFRMMEEVLGRRIVRGLGDGDLPDLFLVDGGKGQLGVAVKLLEEHRGCAVEAAAIAKERHARGTLERIFVPGRQEPVPLDPDSPESLYLQRIRDEAHRFAVAYHRQLRARKTLATGLEGIPGIGSKRRRDLIDRFHTLEGIRAAGAAGIAAVVGPELSERVWKHLNRGPETDQDVFGIGEQNGRPG